MSELWLTRDRQPNMHVNPDDMHVDLESPVNLASELTEADLNAQKAGIMGILAARLELLWRTCEPYMLSSLGDGTDIRMAKLGLDVIDRLIKIHEVLAPDRPTKDEAMDEARTDQRRQAVLAELESRGVGMEKAAELLGGDGSV